MLLTLFRHSTIYFISLLLGKVLSVLVFILFARQLGVSHFGDFVLFVTLTQIVTVLGDIGLNQWYQKNAEDQPREKLFSTVFLTRLYTLFISLFFTALFLYMSKSFTPAVSLLFLINLIPEALLSIVDGWYLEKKQSYNVAIKTILKMVLLLVGYLLLRNSLTFTLTILLYVSGSIATSIRLFPWGSLEPTHIFSWRKILKTMKSSSAYAFLIITSFMYARGDSLVVRYALNNTALGLYGYAYRYLESLSLLPTALSQNLFHISAKRSGLEKHQLKIIVFIMSCIGLLVSIALFFSAQFLSIGLAGTQFIDAIPIIRIFSLTLFLFFVNAPLSTVVQSSSLIKQFLPYGIGNTILNIGLNILFVPMYGIQAAAWIMFITEFTGFIINLIFVRKKYATF